MAEENPPHPFEKVFAQIEVLLQKIRENEGKTSFEVSPWIYAEFINLQEKLERLQKTAERLFPVTEPLKDEELARALAAIPPEHWSRDLDLVEKSFLLKKETMEIAKRMSATPAVVEEEGKRNKNSPIEVMQRKESSEEKEKIALERKKKFGRIGGRKNWRPM